MYKTKHWMVLLTAMAMIMMLSSGAMAEAGNKININTASVEELVQLDKVGPKYAERIVVYRTENGPFKVPEEIMLVSGIGEKTFEANKDRIVVK